MAKRSGSNTITSPRALASKTLLVMTSTDDYETVRNTTAIKRLATLNEGKTRGLA